MNTRNTATGVVRPLRNFSFVQRPRKRPAIVHWRLLLAAGPRFARAPRTLLGGWGFIPTATVNAMTRTRSCRGGVALHVTLLALTLYAPTCLFASSVVTTTTIDGGGLHTTSANYAADNSIGGIGGISSAAPDTAKYGYIGQLYDVVSLAVTSMPDSVNEGNTSQLSGVATLDDSSVSGLSGSDITWGFFTYPIQSISGSGLLTAVANVYSAPPATFSGAYLGASSTNSVTVLGPYANSGIPDSWLVQYFGTPPNPNAAPTADVDGTGQNNLFKYVAGLDPTNPASVFVLKIASVAGQPTQKNLIFNPEVSGRTYIPQFRTNMVTDAWATLTGFSGPTTNINQVTVTDLSATQTQKFYRVSISLP
ncbi:MAG TPA: hypothetical protein VMV72_07545 [Verrucomicrobiae bacterium]|nr:hypothetical protein [Verrucomicrobiae bacterium]